MLDAAAAEFRVHGYADTSTEQLCEAAGLRRSSLYNAFTSKDELFVQALRRYISTAGGYQEAVLTDGLLSGAARVRGLLDLVIGEEQEASRDGHAAGCMIVATRMSPDLGKRDVRINNLLDQALRQQMSIVGQAVRVGQADGSLKPDLPVEDAVRAIVALISGLRVLAQAGASPDELRRTAEVTLRALTAD
ncbi:TetR/AcrR family transcriptional regulator [Arthrobacter sp. EpRS71]|uniref:TetR/AcrR family transcriptional regulator n=1 Tax=Arthrobacter sp. EpRS71 TaxID=1743141 RepID=UPI001E43824B|nr:TetR/AcrR family transcriptional regulator [Arthrobacter sp. EpRS71]